MQQRTLALVGPGRAGTAIGGGRWWTRLDWRSKQGIHGAQIVFVEAAHGLAQS